jgi:hypothetical protein
MSRIDAAALRRFDFKLRFRALKPAQRLALFAREALGDAAAPVPPELARYLTTLETLTPGDFTTVFRQRELLGETPTPEQPSSAARSRTRSSPPGAPACGMSAWRIFANPPRNNLPLRVRRRISNGSSPTG